MLKKIATYGSPRGVPPYCPALLPLLRFLHLCIFLNFDGLAPEGLDGFEHKEADPGLARQNAYYPAGPAPSGAPTKQSILDEVKLRFKERRDGVGFWRPGLRGPLLLERRGDRRGEPRGRAGGPGTGARRRPAATHAEQRGPGSDRRRKERHKVIRLSPTVLDRLLVAGPEEYHQDGVPRVPFPEPRGGAQLQLRHRDRQTGPGPDEDLARGAQRGRLPVADPHRRCADSPVGRPAATDESDLDQLRRDLRVQGAAVCSVDGALVFGLAGVRC